MNSSNVTRIYHKIKLNKINSRIVCTKCNSEALFGWNYALDLTSGDLNKSAEEYAIKCENCNSVYKSVYFKTVDLSGREIVNKALKLCEESDGQFKLQELPGPKRYSKDEIRTICKTAQSKSIKNSSNEFEEFKAGYKEALADVASVIDTNIDSTDRTILSAVTRFIELKNLLK